MRKITKLFLLPLAALTVSGCQKNTTPSGEQESAATISLDKTSAVVVVGHSETLTATAEKGTGAVAWTSSDTSIATVDANGVVTAVAKGTATITATYSGKTATCTVVTKNVNDVYKLTAVQPNANLATFATNVANEEHEFRGETSPVLEVGDANPVQLKPVLKIIDVDTFDPIPQSAWEYDYEYEIKKLVGTEYVALTEEAGSFDAAACTFDFAATAVGSQFKLTVRPGGLTEAEKAKAENSVTVEVKVSEGYNVYTAKELAYANDVNFLKDDRQGNDDIIADINGAWKAFRRANGLDETYLAPAIFLQADIKLTTEALPSEFFFTAAESEGHPEWVGKLKDATEFYVRYARYNFGTNEEPKVLPYTFNGNYFHIDTSEVPLGVDNLSYKDNVSHSTIFKTVLREASDVEEIVNVTYKNCSYYGNSPRGNNAEDAMGLMFFKINNTHYLSYSDEQGTHNSLNIIRGTFDNFNVTRACISFFGEVGRNQLVIKDCDVSEGYSNCIYLWNNGDVDFQNSRLANFGGPVIITDGDGDDDGGMNTIKGFHVHADVATEFDNYVTGAEPWFLNTMGGLPASKMTDIKQLNGVVQAVSNGKKTFVVGSNELMNMIIINYGEIPYLQFQKDSGTQIGIDTESALRPYVEGYLGYGAPTLMSDNGCSGAWTGSWNPYGDPMEMGGDFVDIIHALPMPPEAQFPNNTLYLSIVFGIENAQ